MFSFLVAAAGAGETRDWLMRVLNISSYAMLPWIVLGLGAQLVFCLRMAVQWISSEREKRSVVPTAFWWLSVAGGIMLFVYFCWRKDIVGVLGQSIGLLVYARNLWFIHKAPRGAPVKCLHGDSCPICAEDPALGGPLDAGA